MPKDMLLTAMAMRFALLDRPERLAAVVAFAQPSLPTPSSSSAAAAYNPAAALGSLTSPAAGPGGPPSPLTLPPRPTTTGAATSSSSGQPPVHQRQHSVHWAATPPSLSGATDSATAAAMAAAGIPMPAPPPPPPHRVSTPGNVTPSGNSQQQQGAGLSGTLPPPLTLPLPPMISSFAAAQQQGGGGAAAAALAAAGVAAGLLTTAGLPLPPSSLVPRKTYVCTVEYGMPGGSEYACVPLHEVWEDLVPQLHVRVSGEGTRGVGKGGKGRMGTRRSVRAAGDGDRASGPWQRVLTAHSRWPHVARSERFHLRATPSLPPPCMRAPRALPAPITHPYRAPDCAANPHPPRAGDVVEGDPQSILRVSDSDTSWFMVSGDSGAQIWIEVELPSNMRVVSRQARRAHCPSVVCTAISGAFQMSLVALGRRGCLGGALGGAAPLPSLRLLSQRPLPAVCHRAFPSFLSFPFLPFLSPAGGADQVHVQPRHELCDAHVPLRHQRQRLVPDEGANAERAPVRCLVLSLPRVAARALTGPSPLTCAAPRALAWHLYLSGHLGGAGARLPGVSDVPQRNGTRASHMRHVEDRVFGRLVASMRPQGLCTQVGEGDSDLLYSLRTSESTSTSMQFEYTITVDTGPGAPRTPSWRRLRITANEEQCERAPSSLSRVESSRHVERFASPARPRRVLDFASVWTPRRGRSPATGRTRRHACVPRTPVRVFAPAASSGVVRLSVRKLRLFGRVEISLTREGPAGARDVLGNWRRRKELAAARQQQTTTRKSMAASLAGLS